MEDKKILFTSVFGPYGVTDKYILGLGTQMELINNQITREQGVHSPRQDALSFCLYLLAENISIPSTVLDFPKWKDFERELEKGYSHVGISFIMNNILKAKKMAEYIRDKYPKTKIILGGYGANFPELEDVLPYDEICYGEGVKWLREYFGDDTEVPIKHPIIKAHSYHCIYGYKSRPNYSVILPGVGCKNACDFCNTSHKFGKKYIPLLKTGKDIFDACFEIEQKLGYRAFSIMDENFLANIENAKQLLEEMEKHKKYYNFFIFCSARAAVNLGVEFLSRIGVRTVWIGIESKLDLYNKTKGIDVPALIEEIQSCGISVIASSILFLDHHDKNSIYEDIDWVISLEPDMIQFMVYTPAPGTALHERLGNEERLKDIPVHKITGQADPGYLHPNFPDTADFERICREAFQKNYRINGPGILNNVITAIRGYEKCREEYMCRQKNNLKWNSKELRYERSEESGPDEFMKVRIEIMYKIARKMGIFLLPARIFAPNKKIRKKARRADHLFKKVIGDKTIKEKIKSYVLVVTAAIEFIRITFHRLLSSDDFARQPSIHRTSFKGNEKVRKI